MSRFSVVVTDHDFDGLGIEQEILGEIADVRALSSEPGNATLSGSDFHDADAVINLRCPLNESAIDSLEDCRIIARYGIGVDNIDVEVATQQEIYVTNVPTYCIEEVSTHALSLLLSTLRRIPAYDRSVAMGDWDREVGSPIHRFSTQTVGVVGFGSIGRAVGKKAAALGAEVLASDPLLEPEDLADTDADLVAFEELIEESDYVTIHSPLTDDTRGMFDDAVFDQMRSNAYLINVARGPIVDEDALLTAVDSGEIGGACLDVFPDEPPESDDPLRAHEDVLATPHVAWYSEEANAERRRSASEAVRTALMGDRPEHVVNDVP